MQHTKFQGNWPSGSAGEDFLSVLPFGHGGYLGHVTFIIRTKFHSTVKRLHIKFN